MKTNRFVLTVPLCALSAASFAIYSHDQLDASAFGWVGLVGGGGSGTAISPHFVLTAGHVGGMTFSFSGGTYTAVERINHPTADISLLRFNETFTEFSMPYFGGVLGADVTLVGFGNTGVERQAGDAFPWTGYNDVGGFGTRRAATNRVEFVDFADVAGYHTNSLWYDLDFYDPRTPAPNQVDTFGLGGALDNEGGLLGGDSGGAALLNLGGVWRIVGVNTFIGDVVGPNPPGGQSAYMDYGDVFGSTNVGFYQDWIAQNAPEAVPEPATIAALGLGAMALLRKRKKSS